MFRFRGTKWRILGGESGYIIPSSTCVLLSFTLCCQCPWEKHIVHEKGSVYAMIHSPYQGIAQIICLLAQARIIGKCTAAINCIYLFTQKRWDSRSPDHTILKWESAWNNSKEACRPAPHHKNLGDLSGNLLESKDFVFRRDDQFSQKKLHEFLIT